MSRLNTEEEIAIIDGAITALTQQKEVIAQLRDQLGGLPEENEELKASLAAADASDATTDEKLVALKSLVNPDPEPEPEPNPDTPAES